MEDRIIIAWDPTPNTTDMLLVCVDCSPEPLGAPVRQGNGWRCYCAVCDRQLTLYTPGDYVTPPTAEQWEAWRLALRAAADRANGLTYG